MKFKMFTGLTAVDVENQVNVWLLGEGKSFVVKTSGSECAMMNIPRRIVHVPQFLVSIFYEDAVSS
jgi:hypothetical protein